MNYSIPVKMHQLLTAYACDTAQTEVTGKGAKKYLEDHDIVNDDLARISEQPQKRKIRETKIRILLLDFHRLGMERVINAIEKMEEIPAFEVLYEQYKKQIEEML